MTDKSELARSNRKLLLVLLGIIFGMSAFVLAMVPLYDVFCEVFGINGKVVSRNEANASREDLSRTVTVEFVAQVDRGMPWDFEPLQKKVDVHPGQVTVVSFRVHNNSAEHLIGQAIYSVAPGQASLFINKTECFCFRQQALDGGKTADLSLAFFVDRDLPAHISNLAMQYTLYNVTATAKPETKVAVQ